MLGGAAFFVAFWLLFREFRRPLPEAPLWHANTVFYID